MTLRRVKRTKDDNREIALAIKRLREHLGESQQSFSNRLEVSIRSIARWETETAPPNTTLMELAVIARAAGRNDLAGTFVLHSLRRYFNSLPSTAYKESATGQINLWLMA